MVVAQAFRRMPAFWNPKGHRATAAVERRHRTRRNGELVCTARGGVHLMVSQMLMPRALLSGGGGADVEHATALNGLELT